MTSVVYGEEPESSPLIATETILIAASFFFGIGLGQVIVAING